MVASHYSVLFGKALKTRECTKLKFYSYQVDPQRDKLVDLHLLELFQGCCIYYLLLLFSYSEIYPFKKAKIGQKILIRGLINKTILKMK